MQLLEDDSATIVQCASNPSLLQMAEIWCQFIRVTDTHKKCTTIEVSMLYILIFQWLFRHELGRTQN